MSTQVNAHEALESRGVFSDREIFAAVERGDVIIDPFNPDNVKGSSVDVTVGCYYFETERNVRGGIYNPFDETNVRRYFGQVQKAITHEQFLDESGLRRLEGIPLDHDIIVIGAGHRILAHTREFIGVRPGVNATTMMKARSSTGRNGFSVCHDAGWGDPGYFNRWTMEIQNINREHPLVLPVGTRVAQIALFRTGPVDNPYVSKYQSTDTSGMKAQDALELIKANWRPEDMLPRTYRDGVEPLMPIHGLAEGLE